MAAPPPVSTSTSKSSTSSTPTYTPLTITSFPRIPLTTTFTPRDPGCSDVHLGNLDILFIDDQTESCLPSGFNSAPTAFFSPGIACPSGYWGACTNSEGVSSITTITCCPTRGTSIHMTCVPDPESLAGPWVNQYCTWTAGNSRIPIEVVQVKNGSTSRSFKTLSGVDGINALGVRMVHQATDIATSGPPTTTGPPTTSGPTQTPGGNGGSLGSTEPATSSQGLSTGATVAIGVIVPVVAIAALVGLFLLWRKRRREVFVAPKNHGDQTELQRTEVDENKVYYTGVPQELSVPAHHIEMPGTRTVAELPADAGPGAWQHR
ncbi:hypothetical protein B0T16DRAFT_385506 [Cercophora newfieldiana]|uniref:Uncharacterized protein n=1 Tax=Cercophora newfieldiana TaxID=92897 RepID=A0AA40D1A7_9PEZI|nr:hypothetical protein B0T16DRAFT_385506 [Cercophora newfieldiana]